MKILHICPISYLLFKSSGSAKVAYELSDKLSRNGHMVCLLTTDKHANCGIQKVVKVNNKFIVYHCNLLSRILTYRYLFYVISYTDLKMLSKIIRYADVVHMHDYRSSLNLYAARYAQKYSIPYILQAHGSLLRTGAKQGLKWIYDVFFGYRLLRNASKVIALSPVEARQYKRMGAPEAKIAIIPNGIDLLKYTNLPPEGRFKDRYNIEKGKKVVLFLGRINRFKGIDFLINAFAYLIKSMKYDDAILVIGGPDDGYLDETKKLIKRHKIKDKVLFTGPLFGIRKVEAYIDASIVASLDSLKEVVFLLVPLEAAACGTPVIVTKSNYIATLAEKGKFGAWVEYGNVPKLASMLEEMLNNEDLLREMGSNGRKFVSENFNWNNIVRMIEEVYMDVVETRDNAT